MRKLISSKVHYVTSEGIRAKMVYQIFEEPNGQFTIDVKDTGVGLNPMDNSPIYDIEVAEELVDQFGQANLHERAVKQGPAIQYSEMIQNQTFIQKIIRKFNAQ